MRTYSIGELAKLAEVSIRTLRHYNKTKLIERAKYN
ncbi:MAG: MerR family DNA-binding transcriptional regulator [Balneola sp.]|nr:MerR family DNA-binding transcriptional regulator [Balneola sp.]